MTGSRGYLDHLSVPNMLYAVFATSRTPTPDSSASTWTPRLSSPGVIGALTGKDLEGRSTPCPPSTRQAPRSACSTGAEKKATIRKMLAVGEVNFAGEAVAVVFAESPYQAEDEAELVEVDYEPLEAVVDVEAAIKPGSPKVHQEFPDNIGYHYLQHDVGDVKAAFRSENRIVKVKRSRRACPPWSRWSRGG